MYANLSRLALCAAVAAGLHAQSVEFSDSTFDNADWTSTKIFDSTAGASATFSASQTPSGGNPGSYRQVTHRYGEGTIYISHLRAGTTYNPSMQGAITSITYSYDAIHLNPPPNQAVGYGLLLLQSGSYYSPYTRVGADEVLIQRWTAFSRSGLIASDFAKISGTGPVTPDFSTMGGPIQFGYVTANTSTGSQVSRQSGIDNWLVRVSNDATPGPSCALNPQNMFLSVHQPEYHVGGRYPNHTVTIRVTSSGAPVRGTTVSLSASRPIFAGAAGSPGSQTQGVTDSNGQVTFTVNPPAGQAFDRTDLTASGSAGSESFRCLGTVVTGMGTVTALSSTVNASPRAALLRRLRAQFDLDYDRFWLELRDIASSSPELQQRAESALLRLEPVLRDVLDGRRSKIRAADLAEIDQLLRSFHARGSRELQGLISRWRRDIAGLDPRMELLPGSRLDPAAAGRSAAAPKNKASFNGVDLSFEPNVGQAGRDVHFLARAGNRTVLLTRDGVTLLTSGAGYNGDTVRMKFVGGTRRLSPSGAEPLAARSHYLLGPDPKQWRTNVRHYARVRYPAAYPGTDVVFYGDRGALRYDFVLSPGARPDRIKLQFEGILGLELETSGTVLLHQRRGSTHLHQPVVYQERDGVRRQIAAKYLRKGPDSVGFEVGPYDPTAPLVIDPVISYSSYVGGSNEDAAFAVAVDAQGSAYIAGLTSSANFGGASPVQPARPAPGPNNVEAFVTKLTPDGSRIVYSTYFGGSDVDIATGITLDARGNAYVTGSTKSRDFPVTQALQSTFGGGTADLATDAFVLKLNPAGSALLYSTYLGGSGADVSRGIAVDSSENVYVAGFTSSANFPTRNAFQASLRGGAALASDGFVAKLNSTGTALAYSTYLGGSGDDLAMGLAIDSAGNAYVAGLTYSANFPVQSAIQPLLAGSSDAFVAKLNSAGSALVYSTYLGGASDDFALAVAVDAGGSAYIAGATGSSKFPLVAAAQSRFGSPDGVGFDGFVAKLLPSGASLAYSTFAGGGGTDVVQGIAVGSDGAAYIAGETDSNDFPALTSVAPAGESNDGFLAKLNPAGSAWEYASYIGGSGLDSAAAVAVNAAGNAFIVGSSRSPDYPVTFGTLQTLAGGRNDAIALRVAPGTSVPRLAILSAASLARGSAVAPDSIVSAFGSGLASRTEVAPAGPLPSMLAGTALTVKDSAGIERLAQLYFVSAGQINFVLPPETAPGLAELTLSAEGRTAAAGTVRVEAVAPALFSANADGRGAPAALAIRLSGSSQTVEPLFVCGATPGSCAPAVIDLGPETDQLYLTLFGTGIRGNSSLEQVSLTVGGENVAVTFAGLQGEYPGFDQVNAGPLPRALAGRSRVDLTLTVNGKVANKLTVNVK